MTEKQNNERTQTLFSHFLKRSITLQKQNKTQNKT